MIRSLQKEAIRNTKFTYNIKRSYGNKYESSYQEKTENFLFRLPKRLERLSITQCDFYSIELGQLSLVAKGVIYSYIS